MRNFIPAGIGVAVKTSLSAREILGLITGTVKLDTMLPTAHHRSDVLSEQCYPDAMSRRWPPPHVTCFGVISGV